MERNNNESNDLQSFPIPVPTFIIIAFVIMIVSGLAMPFIGRWLVVPFGICWVVLGVYSFYIFLYILPNSSENDSNVMEDDQKEQEK